MTLLVFSGCTSDDEPAPVAPVELGPVPPDVRPSQEWLALHSERVESFERVATELADAGPGDDCDTAAQEMADASGDVVEYLELVAGVPDPVMSEILLNNAQAARALLSACFVREVAVVEEERQNLRAGLELAEQRRQELGAGG